MKTIQQTYYRPILFSPEMVRAVLSGKKTQTRRIWQKKYSRYFVGERFYVREPYKIIGDKIQYKADFGYIVDSKGWKPSMFMPRKYSRIELEITGLRREPLQEISESDAIKEGVSPEFETDLATFILRDIPPSTYKIGFKHIFEKINGKDIWNKNPDVCVIEFKIVAIK